MIPVEHEDIEEIKRWGCGLWKILEKCVFCNGETRYWHTPSNNTCCQACASKHRVNELPNMKRNKAT